MVSEIQRVHIRLLSFIYKVTFINNNFKLISHTIIESKMEPKIYTLYEYNKVNCDFLNNL